MPQDSPDWNRQATTPEIPLASELGSVSSVTVPVSGNVQSLRILVASGGTAAVPTVAGVTTGFQFGPVINTLPNQLWVVQVDDSYDSRVTVSWSAAPGHAWYVIGTCAVEIIASIDAATQINTQPSNGFTTKIGGIDAADNVSPWAVNDSGQGSVIIGSLGNLKCAQVLTTLAAGASSVLQAGSGSKIITIYGYDITIDPAAATVGIYVAQLQGVSAGTPVAATRCSIRQATAVGDVAVSAKMGALWIPNGFQLSSGDGLQVLANGANVASVDVAGTVFYTQI